MSTDQEHMHTAYQQALKSYNEGGLPIGAVMVDNATGEVVAVGHNRRVQDGNPILHGEMDCFQNAGRRPNYKGTTLYTTLSPCMMCSGTIVQFGVQKVVIGENVNFEGNMDFLKAQGVEVVLLDDTECKALMGKFIQEKPELWAEDIAEGESN